MNLFAQKPFLEGVKNFEGITIPMEISPRQITLPPASKPDADAATLKIYLYESLNPLRRVLLSHTRFLEVDVDAAILEGNTRASIESLKGESSNAFLVKKSLFANSRISCQRYSIIERETNHIWYECFRFHNRRSIWWINFISQEPNDGTSVYAEKFMQKVSLSPTN